MLFVIAEIYYCLPFWRFMTWMQPPWNCEMGECKSVCVNASGDVGTEERLRAERIIKRKWRAERGSKEGKKKGQGVDLSERVSQRRKSLCSLGSVKTAKSMQLRERSDPI